MRDPYRPAALLVCACGVALHAYTALVKASGGPSAFSLGLLAYSALPYLACAVLALRFGKPLPALCGAAAALAADGWMFHGVFIAPRGSTSALGLLVMPALNLLIVVPLGSLLGLAVAKATRAGGS